MILPFLTTNHLKQLIRFTRNITLVFDGDKAGQAATIKSIENLLPEGVNVNEEREKVNFRVFNVLLEFIRG